MGGTPGATNPTIEWFLEPPTLNYVVQLVAALMLESILYGIHFILFCIAAYKLYPRQLGPRVILFLFIIITFATATADVALSFWFVLRDIPAVSRSPTSLTVAVQHLTIKNAVFVANNLLADSLLIYRFFVVWGRRKLIIILPILILLSETVSGFLLQMHSGVFQGQVFTPGYLWCVFALNTTLTLLTAARIWWLSRRMVSATSTKHFRTIAAILTETGATYTLVLLFVALMPFSKGWHFYPIALLYRFVGIMPTLMIVQIEWGRDVLSGLYSTSDPSSTAVVSTIPATFSMT